MKLNKQAKVRNYLITGIIILVVSVFGIMAYMFYEDKGGIYTEVKEGDLNFKALGVYQYIDSLDNVEKVKDVYIEVENFNDDRDYNLKFFYSSDGQNVTHNVEILGGNTELVRVPDVFTKSEITDKNIYSKIISVEFGESKVPIKYQLNYEKVSVDRTNTKVRVPELVIAEKDSQSLVLWYDVADNQTISNLIGVEGNDSKITIVSVEKTIEELNANEWAKVILSYDVKGSVLTNKYLEDVFNVKFEVIYDGVNETEEFNISQDMIKTTLLPDFATLQKTSFEAISSVN